MQRRKGRVTTRNKSSPLLLISHFSAIQVNGGSTYWLFAFPQENNRQLTAIYKYSEGHLKCWETTQSICLTGTNLEGKISQGVLSLQHFLCFSYWTELHCDTLGKSPLNYLVNTEQLKMVSNVWHYRKL